MTGFVFFLKEFIALYYWYIELFTRKIVNIHSWITSCPDGITPNSGLTGPRILYLSLSIYIYIYIHWTLTKRLEKLDGNYTRMLRAILNKFWRQHPTKHQLYGPLPPITETIQDSRTRHAGHYTPGETGRSS